MSALTWVCPLQGERQGVSKTPRLYATAVALACQVIVLQPHHSSVWRSQLVLLVWQPRQASAKAAPPTAVALLGRVQESHVCVFNITGLVSDSDWTKCDKT